MTPTRDPQHPIVNLHYELECLYAPLKLYNSVFISSILNPLQFCPSLPSSILLVYFSCSDVKSSIIIFLSSIFLGNKYTLLMYKLSTLKRTSNPKNLKVQKTRLLFQKPSLLKIKNSERENVLAINC